LLCCPSLDGKSKKPKATNSPVVGGEGSEDSDDGDKLFATKTGSGGCKAGRGDGKAGRGDGKAGRGGRGAGRGGGQPAKEKATKPAKIRQRFHHVQHDHEGGCGFV